MKIHTFGAQAISQVAQRVHDALIRLRSQEEISTADLYFNQLPRFHETLERLSAPTSTTLTHSSIPIRPNIPTRYQTAPISVSFPKQSLVPSILSESLSDSNSLSNLQELAQDTSTLTTPTNELEYEELPQLLKVTSIQFPIRFP
jgi:hypothetical protein